MAAAKNAKQLNALLMKELKKAMNEANRDMLSDMRDETVGFYTGSSPKVYERTGALAETPRVTDVNISSNDSGGQASFKAYLDEQHNYTTGRSPSMELVLKHANTGGNMTNPPMRAVVGNSGFWERAEEKMKKSFDDAMVRHF